MSRVLYIIHFVEEGVHVDTWKYCMARLWVRLHGWERNKSCHQRRPHAFSRTQLPTLLCEADNQLVRPPDWVSCTALQERAKKKRWDERANNILCCVQPLLFCGCKVRVPFYKLNLIIQFAQHPHLTGLQPNELKTFFWSEEREMRVAEPKITWNL